MIIEEICIRNFGVYRGSHKLLLEPTSKNRPIIVVGAMNGAGKTTLLDAMQLALYGKLGTYASRGDGSYEDFLQRTTNYSATAQEGAGIELTFRQAKDGNEQSYRICRSWAHSDGRFQEHFQVFRDGEPDNFLSEHWYEYVEELLPSRIAPLFFFDGEKVVELADAKKAPQLLRVAIQSLLGLDIVQQLRNDLTVLTRRKRAEIGSNEEREKIEADQKELERLDAEYDAAYQNAAALSGEMQRARSQLEEARAKFREEGGELYDQRAALEAQIVALDTERQALQQRLREIAAGQLPLLLLKSRFAILSAADQAEQSSQNSKAFFELLAERDRWILKSAKTIGISSDLVVKLKAALEGDREQRRIAKKSSESFPLTEEARASLAGILSGRLDFEADQARQIIKTLEDLNLRATDLERKLTAVPDSETVAVLTATVKASEEKLKVAEAKLKEAESQLSELNQDKERLRRRLVASLENEVETHHQSSDAARILNFASKASFTLEAFETAVIRHHIHRLESLVLEVLSNLMRKGRLIQKIKIDPSTLEIALTGANGNKFTMERLSVGERQLLAVSLLWALAKASGRPIPTVIDTPLGRLDSSHRSHLVERYFPKASHQVILLSTDTEIGPQYFKKLKHQTSRSYTLIFNPKLGGTEVCDGYAFAGDDVQ